jgi:UDP-N-acetylmuramoyl-L-alanyl-D-glutamate--2,6-diaminopimelate ligase
VAFDVALFTNLSRDHLDYHGTMAAYGAAKARLFAWPGLRVGVVNADDPFGQSLVDVARAKGRKVLTYGFGTADIVGGRLTATNAGIAFAVETPWGRGEIHSRLVGAFNAANLLGVLGVMLVSGVSLETAVGFLAGVDAPPGRMQRLGGELVCVFGCGGDRDRGKRPEMGRVAARLADRVIVTSDNPRSEDPGTIASDIVHGIRDTGNRRYAVELDRANAIATAIAEAKVGDVVLLAGKGHEPYQERAGVQYPFLDADHAARALALRSGQ